MAKIVFDGASPIAESGAESSPITETTSAQGGTTTERPAEEVGNNTPPNPSTFPPVTPNTAPGNSGNTNQQSNASFTDPNGITVTIEDDEAPVVVLFGPKSCGKTMLLIRMSRFLQQHGFRVSPVRTFRPAIDTHYAELCNNYNQLVNSPNAAEGTSYISFMLVQVLTQTGKRICQILEAPGEYYFDPQTPQQPFPAYVNTILGNRNRRVWVFVLEPEWMDRSDRANYVARIQMLKAMMGPQDKAILLYNKVDKSPSVISPGVVNMGNIRSEIAHSYPGIFTYFENQNPITKWFRPYNCDVVPFSSGFFTQANAQGQGTYVTYQQGPDIYPQLLWRTLLKRIRG